MTDKDMNGAMNGLIKKYRMAQFVYLALLIVVGVTMYFAGFITRTEAQSTFVSKDTYIEHVKAQDETFRQIRNELRNLNTNLSSLNNYLRNEK
jgi:hypothetical protein